MNVQHHFVSDVLHGVGGGDREIAPLMPYFVAEVGVFLASGVPDALGGVFFRSNRFRGGQGLHA